MDFEDAAAFPVNYFTACLPIGRPDCGATQDPSRSTRPEETASVLIHAVAGGVGTAAVQIGRLLGVEMFGTASASRRARAEGTRTHRIPSTTRRKTTKNAFARSRRMKASTPCSTARRRTHRQEHPLLRIPGPSHSLRLCHRREPEGESRSFYIKERACTDFG